MELLSRTDQIIMYVIILSAITGLGVWTFFSLKKKKGKKDDDQEIGE